MKKFTPLLLLPCLLFSSCSPKTNDLKENILDDNYRNYYQIFVHSFCDTNGDGIGDLPGVISKLDYIRDLGYTGIWLTPIFKSSTNHKYNAQSYYEIDKQFGTMDDLDKLIDECHERDIKLIIDLVLNHSSASNPYFTKAVDSYTKSLKGVTLTEEEEKYKDFYVFYENEEEARAAHVEQYKAYSVNNVTIYYECNFDADMPEFNFDSPYVMEEFENIIKYYLEKGIDGFRLDAVKYFYYGSSTKSIEALNKIKSIANKYNPSNYIVGECWEGASIISNYYEGSSIDSFFWFPAAVSNSSFVASSLALHGGYRSSYTAGLNRMVAAAGDNIPAPFLDNHDMSRYSTSNAVQNKIKYGLLSMLNGTTFTYYGDEIGIAGSTGMGGDSVVRDHMNWVPDGEEGGETRHKNLATYSFPSVKEQLSDPNSILNYYKKANKIRNTFKSIARGAIGTIDEGTEENCLVTIEKTYEDEKIVIAINFSDVNVATYPTELKLQTCLTVDSSDSVASANNVYTIPSYGIAVFK